MSPFKDPEKKREYNRQYGKKYYEANKERLLERQKEYYQENIDSKRAYHRQHAYDRRRNDPEHAQRCLDRGKRLYKENRQYLIDYLGGKCTSCGATENLEFDHKDPNQKSFAISANLKQSINERMMNEIDKCHLLCNDCHLKKTWTLDKDSVVQKAKQTRAKNNEL